MFFLGLEKKKKKKKKHSENTEDKTFKKWLWVKFIKWTYKINRKKMTFIIGK